MYKFYLFVLILFTSVLVSAQNNLNIKNLESSIITFTEIEADSAIEVLLTKGIINGVNKVSKQNGYFGNSDIKIPFPKDLQIIEKKLRSVGMGNKVDQVILSINRAAEDAAIEATPIFISAIKTMDIEDAVSIVGGKKYAATEYLKNSTTKELKVKFEPVIEASLEKVNATKYWDDLIKAYNKIPLVKKMNPDLNKYVTEEAISGLFFMVAKEEAKIRTNPVARTTDILQKVFK